MALIDRKGDVMKVFLMHIGHPGNKDVDFTIKRRRSSAEVLSKLLFSADERPFFESDSNFLSAFPDGTFNCWGVPVRATPAFQKNGNWRCCALRTVDRNSRWRHILPRCREGDLSRRAGEASQILWPETPLDAVYPWLMFFDTEVGFRDWYDFLEHVGYQEGYNPRGWYKIIRPPLTKWGGPVGYLGFLRDSRQFSRLS